MEKRMHHFKRYLGILFMASLIGLCLGLSACGGGGSATTASTTSSTTPATASNGTVSGSGK